MDPQPRPLDQLFAALADPNRRAMVERLSRGPATVEQLAEPAGMGLPSAVKHLQVLENGGIVMSEKAGRTRTYRMRPGAFRQIDDWVRQREAAMEAAFDRLVQAMHDIPPEEDIP